MKKLWIYILVSLSLAIIMVYTFSENANDYEKQIKKHWKERELTLLNSSPPVIDKELNTFRPDESFRVIASVEHVHHAKSIQLSTSDNSVRNYEDYCYLTFSLKGQEYKLKVLKPVDGADLFLAFTDETSGKNTYGAGRFLPVEIKTNAINTVLDFNYAYNPYCAYNEKYSCPLPPKENHLPLEITAGEKVYKNHQ